MTHDRTKRGTAVDRAHQGQARIKARLIADLDPDAWDLPPKPKWMRWRTYQRYVGKYDHYEAVLNDGICELLARGSWGGPNTQLKSAEPGRVASGMMVCTISGRGRRRLPLVLFRCGRGPGRRTADRGYAAANASNISRLGGKYQGAEAIGKRMGSAWEAGRQEMALIFSLEPGWSPGGHRAVWAARPAPGDKKRPGRTKGGAAGQTPLPDAVPAPSGQASLAKLRPCRTGDASFTAARARDRARQRA
jgi:hypothetical protein